MASPTRSGGQTLTGMLFDQTEHAADNIALRILGEHHTNADLVARPNTVARALRGFRVGQDDVVAVLADNSIEHVLVQFATARLRAIKVMLNTAYRGDFLAHQLNVSGVSTIIADEHLLGSALGIADRLPSLRRIIVRGASGDLPPLRPWIEVLDLADLYAHPTGSLKDVPDLYWTDASTISFASGTTGVSKARLLTQKYLYAFAKAESSIWYRGPDDSFYSCGPLFHLAAKGTAVLDSIYRGARCAQDTHFSISEFWSRIRDQGCTATLMLGSMVILLWTRERSPEEEIQTVVSVPAPPASLQGATEQRWGCTIESVYGLSDAPPLARSCPGVPLRPGSSGKILNGYLDVRILDDDDEPPTGQGRGEVVVRPQRPHVMFQGYYREPATTLGKFRNLWFHTCDLGQLDADDYFYFVNRKENYIRRRGEISSCEVETAIARHPAAPKAAIVGVTSDLIEQAFKTAVVLRDGGRLTHIEFTDESPRCGTSPLLDTFSSCQTYLAPPAERP